MCVCGWVCLGLLVMSRLMCGIMVVLIRLFIIMCMIIMCGGLIRLVCVMCLFGWVCLVRIC